ncbi:hypothetical protein HAX54_029406, partial [Datura stramonium]|nr:hypothetical protein [Datura stramonium]
SHSLALEKFIPRETGGKNLVLEIAHDIMSFKEQKDHEGKRPKSLGGHSGASFGGRGFYGRDHTRGLESLFI